MDGIDVVCFSGCTWQAVKGELSRLGLIDDFMPGAIPAVAPQPQQDNDAPRRVANIWRTTTPLTGTLGEKYFAEVRGLGPIGDLDAVRWHKDLRAIVALMTDPVSGAPRGIHRTFLNADGTKRERMMLGNAGVVRLTPDEDVVLGLGIAEGVEDSIAILSSGWAPVWACLSCGGIERLPVLSGIEALTVFHDRDDAGTRAAEACAARWTAAGREAALHGR